ncbi:hypothetical protein BDD12DRAFT_46699 [Trichophaea hybrida]|nr:hypothetical protein BDD12DRAFT_46699 [Trichophaea hybrida]
MQQSGAQKKTVVLHRAWTCRHGRPPLGEWIHTVFAIVQLHPDLAGHLMAFLPFLHIPSHLGKWPSMPGRCMTVHYGGEQAGEYHTHKQGQGIRQDGLSIQVGYLVPVTVQGN